MKDKPAGAKVERLAHLRWVPLDKVTVNPLAQRDLNQARVDKLVAEFDPEQLGAPTVNARAGLFFVIDGQHRIEALKVWLGAGWESQQVQCWTYDGLTEDDEAEIFLKLNDTLAVHAFAKFRVAVAAGRSCETDIDRIVRRCGLRISQDKGNGAVAAVGTLVRVYRRADAATLARTLTVIRDAYGDAGLEAVVIDGLGLLCHRYNGDLDDGRLVARLSGARGGLNGLLNKAEVFRNQTGSPKGHCVAAAAVEIYNAGRGGTKLPSWWRTDR
jgi:ParB-like nuclease domain